MRWVVLIACWAAACGDGVTGDGGGSDPAHGASTTGESEGTGDPIGGPDATTSAPGDMDGATEPSDDTSGSDESGTTGPMADPPLEQWRITTRSSGLEAVCVLPDDAIVIVGSDAAHHELGRAYLERVSPEGEHGWRIELGATNEVTFLAEVACAPDGTVYAVGFRGESWINFSPLVVRLDGVDGAIAWEWVFSERFGAIEAVSADGEGAVLGGGWQTLDDVATNIVRVGADQTEVWSGLVSTTTGHANLTSLATVAGTTYAAGFDASGIAVVVALDGEGGVQWTHELNEEAAAALHVAPDVAGTGVVVVGNAYSAGGEATWALRCDAEGCEDAAAPLAMNWLTPTGFVVHPTSQWIVAFSGELRSYAPGDGTALWEHVTHLPQDDLLSTSMLAVDQTGALIVGGENELVDGPASLAKLTLPD